MAQRRKAFVTGASRGIGKAIAIRLAQGGFDVAITARTIEEGEQREHSSTVKKSDTTPLPGSLTSTADAMRAAGAEVLVLPADLLDRGSLGAAATTVLERWGTVDLVVHNAQLHRAGAYGSHHRHTGRSAGKTCAGQRFLRRWCSTALPPTGHAEARRRDDHLHHIRRGL